AVGVREAVAELAAFMDGPGSLGSDVAADVAGEGELLEELLQPLRVLALVRVDLRVCALQVRRTQHSGRSVPRPGPEKTVGAVPDDHAVQVRPDKGEGGARAPVAQQPALDVIGLQGLPE